MEEEIDIEIPRGKTLQIGIFIMMFCVLVIAAYIGYMNYKYIDLLNNNPCEACSEHSIAYTIRAEQLNNKEKGLVISQQQDRNKLDFEYQNTENTMEIIKNKLSNQTNLSTYNCS